MSKARDIADLVSAGSILADGAIATTEITGGSVQKSQQYGRESEEHSRANRRSKSDQAQLDALIDEQDDDDRSDFVKK